MKNGSKINKESYWKMEEKVNKRSYWKMEGFWENQGKKLELKWPIIIKNDKRKLLKKTGVIKKVGTNSIEYAMSHRTVGIDKVIKVVG